MVCVDNCHNLTGFALAGRGVCGLLAVTAIICSAVAAVLYSSKPLQLASQLHPDPVGSAHPLTLLQPYVPVTAADGQDGGATVDQGSCMFGHLDYNAGTGYDIVALSDHDPEYAVSVCGGSLDA